MREEVVGNIIEKAEKMQEKLIEYRRKIHQNPEPGLCEHETAKFIVQELEKMNIKVQKNLYTRKDIKEELDKLGENIKKEHGPTGVVGIIEGTKVATEEKTIALRTDMDALLVNESNSAKHLPAREGFRSNNEGLMHACGHDAHIAMLLGAAQILVELKSEFAGQVKLIFQPDEERGCGAKLICKAGVLDDVDAIYGLHVWSPIESGKVMINDGAMMASVDNFWLSLIGGGGHSSMPHETSDPLLAATELVNHIYKMNAREVDTRDPSLVSVEMFDSKADWGVIPDKAELRGTIRTFDKKVRKNIINKIIKIGNSVADQHGLEFSFKNLYAFPPTINTIKETEIARKAAQNLFKKQHVFSDKPVMSGEDFAYYQEKIPGTFMFLGISDQTKGSNNPHHNPDFDVDESVLKKGTALHVLTALNYLEK